MSRLEQRVKKLKEKVGGTDEEEKERMRLTEEYLREYLKKVEERQRQRAEKEKAEKLGPLKPLVGDTVH